VDAALTHEGLDEPGDLLAVELCLELAQAGEGGVAFLDNRCSRARR
jgi:hypothetical protein